MGDGGVACMPLQQQHNIMERFPITEAFCGSSNGSNSKGFNSKLSFKLGEAESRKKMRPKWGELLKKGEVEKGELGLLEKKNDREVGDVDICNNHESKDEVEEGELGTLKLPGNGEFVVGKKLKSEIGKREAVSEKWRKQELDKGEVAPGKLQKGVVNKGQTVQGKSRCKNNEKCEYESQRDSRDAEKGAFVCERWQKAEPSKDDYSSVKAHRNGRGWKSEHDHTPPSRKCSSEDNTKRKEFSRKNNSRGVRSSRWECATRLSSYKSEQSNGRNHGRDHGHGTNSESIGHKHHGEHGDYVGSKIRRLSDDSNRFGQSEHYSRHSTERSLIDRCSLRHHDPTLPSKVVHDRYGHGRSPGRSNRSPCDRSRYLDRRDHSPIQRERSLHSRWERSPYDRREKSPHERNHSHPHKISSPCHAERTPQSRTHRRDRREQTPSYRERSLLEWSKTCRKNGSSEKQQNQDRSKRQEELTQTDFSDRDLKVSVTEHQNRRHQHDGSASAEKTSDSQSQVEEHIQNSYMDCREDLGSMVTSEEPPSMEEDMDICDTPPHFQSAIESSTGNWFYLDHFGIEHGPSKLSDLKALMEQGVLFSDHLIKHSQTDRWVTVENADSPSPTLNIPSIIPETVTQLVSPPEAPGNLLPDSCDAGLSGNHLDEEAPTISSRKQEGSDYASEPLENLQIDERVEILLKGLTITPGRELEAVAEALQMTFEHPQCERWGNFEGFTWPQSYHAEPCDYWKDELSSFHEITSKEIVESRSALPSDKDHAFSDLADWFVGRWSSKGGDWKRNDEGFQDRSFRRKLVLNDGLPLCQMLKSGHEDPRWHRKDELYHPSQSRRLELPSWAFSLSDERNDCTVLSRPGQNKPVILRGVKGFMSPVVRINACVVKDHGSFVSEPCTRSRGKEMYSSRPYYPYAKDAKNSSVECGSSSKATEEHESESSWKDTVPIRTPKDRVCTVDDLQLHLGDWYYIDGAGHEHGPSLFSEVQVLVDLGTIHKHSSVFRRPDKVWVPVTSYEASKCVAKVQQEDNGISADAFETSALQLQDSSSGGCQSGLTMFHQLYPQFIGYTRGKLHELVMKSYKSREFAAAIKEVLDPWISAKQPKKDAEKYYNSAATSSFQCLSKYQNSEADSSLMDIDQMRASKRSRMSVDVSEDNYERREVLVMVQKDEPTFEDLCGDVVLSKEHLASSAATVRCWGLLNGYLLARVCHFLRADIRSLACASLTCKHWSTAVKFYKNISRHVDLSSIGPMCSDAMVWVIMSGYKREKIVSLVLSGCMNVTSGMLKEILHSFPSLLSVYIGGCPQFEGLIDKYPNVNWMKSQTSHSTVIFDGSFSKIRSLREITEKTSATSKTPENLGSNADDFDQLKDYFDSVDKREAANQSFRRSLYKRSKVFDARKSSSILSRDARLRRWSVTRSENGYKRMEEFIALTLKDIMKENNFDYFLPKVAEIEGKMKNGYYVGRGLGSVKEDISRMCKDAIRASNRGDAGDMNHIIQLFVQLATCLEESSKSSRKRDEMLKLWKEGSSAGFCATASQYKKKLNKLVNGRKYINRSAGTSFTNGGSDFGEDASYREIRRRLSKLNRKSMDSDSETSNDLERSSDGTSDSKNSYDTESDLDYQSQGCTLGSIEDGYLMGDLSLDSTTEREWGARMTKASLVPPVTRKYEVIDHYVIVADEVDVRRKMRVSLPDDYTEKLNAQKNGSEDMEIPEVKDYKPRKKLGDEVLEQEVYGIDPYTHNLLLDSMPAELEWSQHEKHLFIEDKLLCTLNKQVRNFTGTGNTPMKYPVHPVIEEILKIAEEDCDIQTLRMCQGLLKAIASRPEDSYVSYRKGLGVVCNKPGGFDEDDFVVEFLGEVYPAWKWFEKQDGIRSLQKNSNDPAPEFYNIYLERPKGDGDGYDLVVVDAMHKANYASRICHSCRPNCEAKVTAVDGQYQIGIYSVRKIQYGEEITFDYNSVTESKEEHEASVCLCGSHFCRGSYLNLTGEGAFQKILKEWHGILDRCQLMLEACELNSVSEEDYVDLGRAGLGSCLLGGLPEWLIAYSARLVRFINYERTKLPEEILRRNLEEKRKYFVDVSLEFEKSEAEVQAEGVYNQRLQNLALTLDKVRYVMRCVFGDPKKAPPPLERLGPEAAVSFLWKGEGSLVGELVQYMAPHMEDNTLKDLMFKIRAHDPSCSGNIQKELQRSLLWLRDEVRNLPCNNKCRHDAAADLIHMYAYTNCFLRLRAYKSITSPPVYISSLDLGPKYSDKLGSGLHEYCKTYGENYCLGQLIFWHNQTDGDPDRCLARASRGCLSLPDIGSFYAKVQKPSQQRVYGPRTLKFMLSRMEKQPQKAWPEDRIWSFRSSPEILGSPMLDAVLSNSPLDREMTHWLKNRPAVFQATWDR